MARTGACSLPSLTYVYALDARTGKAVEGFGAAGRIDLREDLGRDPEAQSVRLTTPGVVYRDLLIVGGRVSEGLPASPGDIRAYDARTGRLRWSFHTIPRPGESGHETWSKDSWKNNGGANNWAGHGARRSARHRLRADRFGSADFYGANRPGDNLYANALIALTPRPASGCGTSRQFVTTSGIAICPRRRVW